MACYLSWVKLEALELNWLILAQILGFTSTVRLPGGVCPSMGDGALVIKHGSTGLKWEMNGIA